MNGTAVLRQRWRVTYESIAYELTLRPDVVPAPWSGPRRHDIEAVNVVTPADRKPRDLR
jgi:hypothetical protein